MKIFDLVLKALYEQHKPFQAWFEKVQAFVSHMGGVTGIDLEQEIVTTGVNPEGWKEKEPGDKVTVTLHFQDGTKLIKDFFKSEGW